MTAVAHAMTRPVHSVAAQTRVRELARLLDAEKVRHVLVVDGSGSVLGTVRDAEVWACGRLLAGGTFVPASMDASGLTARELLVAPSLVSPETSLRVALDRLGDHADRVVVVADPEGPPLGILTDRDVLRFASAFLPARLSALEGATKLVVTVTAADTAGAALRTCKEHGFRHLVLVEDRSVVGMVSVRDLIAADAHAYPCQKLGPLASPWPETAKPDISLREAAARMHAQRISALPLLQDGQLVGIVTSTDIARVLRKVLEHLP